MKVKSKRAEQLVKLLRNPDAQFVSIVDHGANQTPFSTLKLNRKSGAGNMSRKKLKKVSSSLTSKAATAVGIRKMSFSSDLFKDTKIVNKWLKDNDWEGYEILKVDGGFEAATKEVSDKDFADIREVAVEEGITAFVGQPKVASEDDGNQDSGSITPASGESSDDSAETKSDKDSEDVTKFDMWGAFLSGGESVADVMKDGMKDGVPPGFDEIVFATTQAMANAMKNDGENLEEKLSKAGKDMATIVFGIHSAFKTLVTEELEGETKKVIDSWNKGIEEATAAKTCKFIWGSEIDDLSPEENSDESLQTSAPEGTDAGDDLGGINHILASFKTEISKSITSLTEKVDSVSAKADKATKEADEARENLESQLKRTPTKKSESEDGSEMDDTESLETVEQAKDAEFEARVQRHALGL